jgi:predicted metalloprotease with PDZ domain
LYKEFYEQKKRGFTKDEFRKVCERIAGTSLADVFDYVSTTKEIDYKKYLNYAGLDIDTTSKDVSGGWLGVTARARNDSVFVSSVDWQSPAWNVGLRQRNAILEIGGVKATAQAIENVFKNKSPSDKIELTIMQGYERKQVSIILGKKVERSFHVSRKPDADNLQKAIFESWLK